MNVPQGWLHHPAERHKWFASDADHAANRNPLPVWLQVGVEIGFFNEGKAIVLHEGKFKLCRGGWDDAWNARWATEYPEFNDLEDAIEYLTMVHKMEGVT